MIGFMRSPRSARLKDVLHGGETLFEKPEHCACVLMLLRWPYGGPPGADRAPPEPQQHAGVCGAAALEVLLRRAGGADAAAQAHTALEPPVASGCVPRCSTCQTWRVADGVLCQFFFAFLISRLPGPLRNRQGPIFWRGCALWACQHPIQCLEYDTEFCCRRQAWWRYRRSRV
jgi:hypothetical protein